MSPPASARCPAGTPSLLKLVSNLSPRLLNLPVVRAFLPGLSPHHPQPTYLLSGFPSSPPPGQPGRHRRRHLGSGRRWAGPSVTGRGLASWAGPERSPPGGRGAGTEAGAQVGGAGALREPAGALPRGRAPDRMPFPTAQTGKTISSNLGSLAGPSLTQRPVRHFLARPETCPRGPAPSRRVRGALET